jgi:hypothetical protein
MASMIFYDILYLLNCYNKWCAIQLPSCWKNNWIIQTMRGAPEFRFKVLPVPKGRNCPKSSDEMVIFSLSEISATKAEIDRNRQRRQQTQKRLVLLSRWWIVNLQPEMEKSGWFHLQLHSFDPWIPMVNWRELWLLCRWVCHTFTGRKKAQNDQNAWTWKASSDTKFL